MRRTFTLVAPFLFAASAAMLSAQQPGVPMPAPRLSGIFPMGGQLGTTVELTLSGTDIDTPTGLLFSAPDIKAVLLVPPEPVVDPKAKDKPKKTGPVTSAKFKVTIPATVTPATYDCRVVNKLGISNPRAFVVGEKPEVNETDKPHNDVPVAQKVELGCVVNGVIASPTDVDYYSFAAKAGQRVLVHCATSSIDSRARALVEIFDTSGKRLAANRNSKENDALADVTIGTDGSYFVRVSEFAYQAGTVDYFYRLSISTAPWIDSVFPAAINPTGSTTVTILGRNLPGGQVMNGATVDGRPLESLSVTITPPAGASGQFDYRGYTPPSQALQDGFEYRVKGPGGLSNLVPIYLTDAKVTLEKDAGNDTPETAEEMVVPGEIAGTIGKRFDKDWFRFTAKKGETFYVELSADRIGSNMDLYYVVKNGQSKTNVVEEQDDDLEMLHPQQFFNRSGDPASAKFTAPADGQYLVLVASRESNVNFGPRCIYRLKVSKPVPDFRAVVMAKGREVPSTTIASQAGEVAFDIFVDRRDGYAGPILATVEGLPAGVTAKTALIGTAGKWGTLVLSSTDAVAPFTGQVIVKCTATIDGKPVVRQARPATISWSVPPASNAPTIARLNQGLYFAVTADKATLRMNCDATNAKLKSRDKDNKETETKLESPIYVKPGDKISLPVVLTWQGAEPRPNPVTVTLEATQVNLQGAAIGTTGNTPAVIVPKEKNDGAALLEVRPTAVPGTYAVVLKGDTQIQIARDPAKKDVKTPANVQAYTQPLEIIVLPLILGKFTATLPANGVIVAGKTTELTVKVDRAADFTGAYQVSVALPKELKGITIQDAVISAGADEVKMSIVVAADAKVGGVTNFVVTAVGTVHGKFPIRHDAKANMTIAAPPKVVVPPKKKP